MLEQNAPALSQRIIMQWIDRMEYILFDAWRHSMGDTEQEEVCGKRVTQNTQQAGR